MTATYFRAPLESRQRQERKVRRDEVGMTGKPLSRGAATHRVRAGDKLSTRA